NKILTEVKNGSMSAQTIDLSKFGDYIRPDEYFFSVQEGLQEELIQRVNQNYDFECNCVGTKTDTKFRYLINMNIISSSGTYIKEFIHGDFGRTEGAFIDILNQSGHNIVQMEMVYLDVVRLIY
ncbi:putative tRNA pseudouridine synthase Pus10, partial [Cucumispora dikerogammari]